MERLKALLCAMHLHWYEPHLARMVTGSVGYLVERCYRWPRCAAERTRRTG